MPYLYNIANQVTGIDPRVLSVRYWPFASVTDRTELPNTQAGFQQCHYLEFEGYDTRQPNNQNPASPRGTLVFPLNRIDTWPQTVFDEFGVGVSTATAVEDLLRAAFPPPTPD